MTTLSPNTNLVEQAKIVQGLSPILPSSSVPDYVSLKGYHRATIIISLNNAAPTLPSETGSVIALEQATAVAGTGAKAIPFTRMWANLDIAASDALVETAVTSNTFTTVTTDDIDAMYVIEITPDMLDMTNDFDCFHVTTGDAVASVLSVLYILWPAVFGEGTPLSAILD